MKDCSSSVSAAVGFLALLCGSVLSLSAPTSFARSTSPPSSVGGGSWAAAAHSVSAARMRLLPIAACGSGSARRRLLTASRALFGEMDFMCSAAGTYASGYSFCRTSFGRSGNPPAGGGESG